MKKWILLTGIIFALCSCGSSENNNFKKVNLTDAQIESLCEQYAELDDSYADIVPSKAMAAIKVFGTERDGDVGYVYCYASEGTYVKVNNKAYNISGGNGPDVLEIRFNGDEIQLLNKSYAVASIEALGKFPKKYRLMEKMYDAYTSGGFCKLQLEEAKKIEDLWEVEVELEYCIDIFEDGSYEVWDFPDDEVITIERGKIEKSAF